MVKTICQIQHKKTEAVQNGDKDGKTLSKLKGSVAYDKNMENLGKTINARLASNEKDYLRLTSKLSYMSKKLMTMI